MKYLKKKNGIVGIFFKSDGREHAATCPFKPDLIIPTTTLQGSGLQVNQRACNETCPLFHAEETPRYLAAMLKCADSAELLTHNVKPNE